MKKLPLWRHIEKPFLSDKIVRRRKRVRLKKEFARVCKMGGVKPTLDAFTQWCAVRERLSEKR